MLCLVVVAFCYVFYISIFTIIFFIKYHLGFFSSVPFFSLLHCIVGDEIYARGRFMFYVNMIKRFKGFSFHHFMCLNSTRLSFGFMHHQSLIDLEFTEARLSWMKGKMKIVGHTTYNSSLYYSQNSSTFLTKVCIKFNIHFYRLF